MSAEDALDESLHVLVVGAGPVEAIGGGADTKIVIILSRSRWQPVMERLFRELAGAASYIGGTGEMAGPSGKG